VVVKLPSPYDENRAQGVGLGMYEAEIRFYRELAAETKARIPGCHLATIVPGTAEFVVVMEDLGHLHMVDQAEGMSVVEADAALRALADVHGSFWGRVDTLDWVPSVLHARIQSLGELYPQLWPAFLANFGDVLPDGAFELGERISARFWPTIEAFAQRPWTLLHQDFRVDNLLFGETGEHDEIAILDWQGLGRGPGAYDLAYVLGGSLPVERRRAHERDLIERYRTRLSTHGVDVDAATLWDDYRFGQLMGGPATVVLAGATLDLANERGKAMIASMAQRHFTACVDLDSATFIA
jgi:aminoglycoside/choline kinase family phosphotransferase